MRTRKEKPQVRRPWGGYTLVKKTRTYWIKKLFINKKSRLSLQSHEHRAEWWLVLSGKVIAQIENRYINATQGDVVLISQKTKHRLEGIDDACVLEIALGRVLERDIVRYEDDYGRI